jgi:hypothetical protein
LGKAADDVPVRSALFGLSAVWVSSCILLAVGRSQFAGARVQRVAGDCHSGGDDLEFRPEQSGSLNGTSGCAGSNYRAASASSPGVGTSAEVPRWRVAQSSGDGLFVIWCGVEKRDASFKQQGVADHHAVAGQIPVIDYGPYSPVVLERSNASLPKSRMPVNTSALNHGVPNEVIDRAFAASRRFHSMPLEQKLALKLNQNNIGYLPINASVQGASTMHKATKPNQNESFFVSHDRGPEHPDVVAGKPLRGRNQWPTALPGIRAPI